jgi:hypothetical protein
MPPRFLTALSLALGLALCLGVFSFPPCRARAAEHVAPPAGDAAAYPAVDIHPEEQVAIAADPCNTREKISIFRVDYLKYGFLPVRIIVTNNSGHPISLEDARINFITAAGDKIPTSETPDVERRIVPVKRPGGAKTPIPLPGLGNKASKLRRGIEADFHDFEYSAAIVKPHTTQSGFFFYDLQDIENPLAGAKLSLSTVRDATGKELFSFEVPFDKYLAKSPGK